MNLRHSCITSREQTNSALYRMIFFRARPKKCFSRSSGQTDLEEIKEIFLERYGKTLESEMERNTKGHFKRLLLAILKGNKRK